MSDKNIKVFNGDKDEILTTEQVSQNILCKDCQFKDDGTVYSNDYTKSCCQKFPYPDMKPESVYNADSKCDQFKKE